MSNYSKTTNFAVKDALLAGDPLKVIKGTDHDTEYNNIATAVATKTDNAAAAIAGGSINATPIGNSTPSTGAFTTLAATTLDSTPIGSVTPSTGKFSTLQATTLDSTPIGSVTPGTGRFTTLSATSSAVWGTGVANFGTIIKRKTADESVTNSTALQDDDHLTFPIGANEEWVAEYSIDCGAALTSTGIRIGVTVPAGASLDVIMDPGSSFLGGSSTVRTSVSGTAIVAGATQATLPDPCLMRAYAWILNGVTSGNVTLQWAQHTLSASPLTFRKGSHMQATRIV